MNEQEIAAKILSTLEKQKFATWYSEGGDFDRYICGDLPKISKDEILAQIVKMFNLAS